MLVSSEAAEVEIETPLAAPASEVWALAVTPEGINEELGPWVSMSIPGSFGPEATIDDLALGQTIGRCWIKVARIPVDFDDLCLVERGPGYRFLERSRLGSARFWQHEREVIATADDACVVIDRLRIEPRAPLRAIGGTAVAERIVRALFRHRHRRLEKRWGSAEGSA